jgi:hypothetical protein
MQTVNICIPDEIHKDTRIPSLTGIECNPVRLSKLKSWQAYMMSNPAVQNITAKPSRIGKISNWPLIAIHAPTGEIASDMPSQKCESEVKRFVYE